MAMRRRRDDKRRDRRGRPDGGGHREHREASDPDDDLDRRLDAVSSGFTRPPTAEELRAAFGRRPVDDRPGEPEELPDDFASAYPAESLFSPTVDEATEPPPAAEDRSRSRGDYYYDPEDAWEVLGVAPGASWHEISAAHRRLAMVHHPDRLLSASDEERIRSEETMREVNVAYSVLRRLTGN